MRPSVARLVPLSLAGFAALALGLRIEPRIEPPRRAAGQSATAPREPRSPGDGDYWAVRATYPTGHFDARWLVAAAADHREVPAGVPAGQKPRRSPEDDSPLGLDPDAFTPLGPQPLDGQFGRSAGRTNVVVSDPSDPSVAYLGSVGGGVWKSVDCCGAATTWTPTTDDPLLASIAINDIALDSADPATVYAGTGDLHYTSWAFGAAGLLKSTDAGATWELLGTDVFTPIYPEPPGVFPQYQAIGKVRVDPRDSAKVVVGTKTGVFFSYDAGLSWTGPCLTNAHTGQRQDVTGMEVRDTGAETELYVAVGTRGFDTPVQPDLDLNGANGIYRAVVPASGCPASWQLLTRPDNGWPAGTGGGVPYPANVLGRIDLTIAPSDPDVLYAQVASIPTRGQLGVWRTLDGGATWQQRSDVNGLTGCFGDWGQNWYDQGVTVDPNDPDVVFMSTVDLFRSTDGGTTFVNLTCGYAGGDVHVDHHARAFVGGDSSRLLIGNDGGVYYSANADAPNPGDVAFVQLNDTLSTIEFYSGDITAFFATSSSPAASAGAQDNGSSVKVWAGAPGPAVWTTTLGGDGMFARIEPVLGQRWYQESQNGNLRVSTTGPFGSRLNASGAWSGDRVSFIHPYEIYKYGCPPTGCTHMIAGTHRVWETIQGAVPASSWMIASGDLTKGTLADRSFINQLSYAVSDPTVAIVGTNDGNVQFGFGLGAGTPMSATWVDVTGANAVLPNRPVLDVTTDPWTPTVGYAAVGGFAANTPATPGHVFRVVCSADCASFLWEDKSGNLPDIPVDSILVNPNLPGQVFAGSDWGLYFTDDIEASPPVWQRFTNGLPTVTIWDMAIDRGFTTLALFTRSRGAYAWPLPLDPDGMPFRDGFESGDTGRWSSAVP
ncbi:MAG: hypothetical protein H6Q03_399 [Acidobacteria bacterium]|nr:hypothetical protein [Acidobacteriota bacterium]